MAKLRRPPVTAWALNRVARSAPSLIDDLATAGAELREAMDEAVAGDASRLRDAQAAERASLDAVVEAGCRQLDESGRPASDANRQRMTATLRAAVVDDTVAAQLRTGGLGGDRDAPGFGLGPDTQSAPLVPRSHSRRGAPAETGGRAERERQRQARVRHAELVGEAQRLARRAARLEDEADQAERRAVAARADADAAAEEAAAAERRASAAGGSDGPDETEPSSRA